MDERDRAELLRLRDKLHHLANYQQGLEGRIHALEKLAEEYVPLIDAIVKEDAIADGIALALQRRGTALPLGWVPRALVLLVSLATLITLIVTLIGAARGH